MSTRKKRSLSNITVSKDKVVPTKKDEAVVPAISKFITESKAKTGRAVRGMEFVVEPDMCKPWKYHNRDEVWLNPDRCSDLISSIMKNGQQFPIVARKLENDPDGKAWEIIAGRRRWYACGYLKKQVRIKAFEGDDREAAIIMNLENKDRDDISEFEDAISYKTQLDAGLFRSQDEMATMLDIKKSKLSKMLAAAKILSYPRVMKLFPDVTKIKINPIYSLLTLMDKSEQNKDVIHERADTLYKGFIKKGKELSASTCIKELIKSVSSSSKASPKKPKVVKDGKVVLFKMQYNSQGNAELIFENKNLLNIKQDKLESIVLAELRSYILEPVS